MMNNDTPIRESGMSLMGVMVAELFYFFFGFIPQKTAFIKITSIATAIMDTQNPIFNPRNSVVPNSFIQILIQFIMQPPFIVARRNGGRRLSLGL